MIEKTWDEFFLSLDAIEFDEFDLIVAVAQGGIIPAAFVQQKLQIPMEIIQVNYRDEFHKPLYDDAVVLEEGNYQKNGKKILLVDDVSRTGKTLEAAKKYLDGNEVKTCVVNGKADYSLFQSETCLRMPWKLN